MNDIKTTIFAIKREGGGSFRGYQDILGFFLSKQDAEYFIYLKSEIESKRRGIMQICMDWNIYSIEEIPALSISKDKEFDKYLIKKKEEDKLKFEQELKLAQECRIKDDAKILEFSKKLSDLSTPTN